MQNGRIAQTAYIPEHHSVTKESITMIDRQSRQHQLHRSLNSYIKSLPLIPPFLRLPALKVPISIVLLSVKPCDPFPSHPSMVPQRVKCRGQPGLEFPLELGMYITLSQFTVFTSHSLLFCLFAYRFFAGYGIFSAY